MPFYLQLFFNKQYNKIVAIFSIHFISEIKKSLITNIYLESQQSNLKSYLCVVYDLVVGINFERTNLDSFAWDKLRKKGRKVGNQNFGDYVLVTTFCSF